LVTLVGLLTHFHFALVLLGSAIFAFVRLVGRHRGRLLATALAVVVGIGIFVAAHPRFYDAVRRGRKQAQVYAADDVPARIERVATCYSQFFFHYRTFYRTFGRSFYPTAQYVAVAALAIVMVTVVVFRLRRRRWSGQTTSQDVDGSAILFFFMWMAGTNIALYLGFLSPKHAMGPRYGAMAWPFYACAICLALQALRSSKGAVSAAACLALAGFGFAAVPSITHVKETDYDPEVLLPGQEQLIVDSVSRRALPRIVWRCPDDLPVFAANQEVFLANKNLWLDKLDVPTLYVSPHGPGKTRSRRSIIVRHLREQYEVVTVPGRFWKVGPSYRILPNVR
jgi:hypothetical protein